jgi:hypothetical protein
MIGFLVFLLSLLSFFQLGWHFWPEWSVVNGIRIDYLSPTVYTFDLVFFVLFLTNPKLIKIKKYCFWVSLLITLNIFFSLSPFVTLYRWVRIFECVWLFLFLDKHQRLKPKFLFGLFLGVLLAGILAISQLIKGSSLGGGWYWLGERSFSLNTPGVSKILFLNSMKLRPYASFPHPNVLAGVFFLVSILFLNSKQKIYKWTGIFCWFVIAFTFSRIIILMQLLVLLIVVFKSKSKLFLFIFPLTLFLFLTHPNSLNERVLLLKDYWQEMTFSSFFGLGLGNSIYYNAKYYLQTQPIHNVYLLIFSELGVIQSLFTLTLFLQKIKIWLDTDNFWKIFFLLTVLASGTVDHYWWTLIQPQIILSICLPFALKLGSEQS